ncbi:hypothetical protein H4219_002850 [Mycoemilia scoparia]|uniref:Pacifastin domain-containing protein n=1 Tax=Mycoemilia scoparia TaxID=417184 RepID=A0A9W8DTH4_9FUNG|nr:hypothetical protein H4219_002850 [Mycoemilia scoparia]
MKSISFAAIAALALAVTTVQAMPANDTGSKEQCIRDHDGHSSWSDGCNNCSCNDNGGAQCTLKYCEDIVNNPLFKCDADNVGRTWKYNQMSCKCTAKGGVVCQNIFTTQ